MTFRRRRITVARLGATMGALCGVIGFFGGLAELPWRLGVTGWFSGGLLLALVSLVMLVDAALPSGGDRDLSQRRA
jgi:hypothetical protein